MLKPAAQKVLMLFKWEVRTDVPVVVSGAKTGFASEKLRRMFDFDTVSWNTFRLRKSFEKNFSVRRVKQVHLFIFDNNKGVFLN